MRISTVSRRGGWGAAIALSFVVGFQGFATGQQMPLPPGQPFPPPGQQFPPPGQPFPVRADVPPVGTTQPPAQPGPGFGSLPGTLTLPGAGETVNVGAPAPSLPGSTGTAPGTAAPPAPSSGPGADGTPLNDYWRKGLRFESQDKAFSIFIGGRFQFDVVDYLTTTKMRGNIPGNVPVEDGVSFRRVRFDMGGTLYKNFEYYAQVDFFNGFVTSIAENRLANVPAITDMWLQYKDLPLIGTVRVGNQKPLYSFEHLTTSRFLNFMERSIGFDAFAEGFNNGFAPGITLLNTYLDKRGTWGIGLFKNTRSAFDWNVGRNEAEVNGRVTFLPIDEEDGKYLLHVGVGGAHRDLDQDQQRFRSRLDARNSPSAFSPLLADTGLMFGNHQQLLIPELVAVAGPLSFQAEYYASWVHQAFTETPDGKKLDPQGTVYMQSAYAEAHLFLTGEHRDYNRETGTFGRVVPNRPFSWTKSGFSGWGAWQLTARYSYLDLIDKGINGGRIHDMTLGVNWFLNPNMKVQWNYFLAHRNVANPGGDGFIQGFGVRTAIDF